MFNERQQIQAIARSRLFDIRELASDPNFVNSEKGEKNLHDYKEGVIDIAVAIAQSNNFEIKESEISLIVNKVFADILGKEV